MFCPKCSKINPDNSEVCSGCGAQLHEEKEAALEKKSGKKGLKVALVCLLVLVVVAALVFLLNGCDPGSITQDSMSF